MGPYQEIRQGVARRWRAVLRMKNVFTKERERTTIQRQYFVCLNLIISGRAAEKWGLNRDDTESRMPEQDTVSRGQLAKPPRSPLGDRVVGN